MVKRARKRKGKKAPAKKSPARKGYGANPSTLHSVLEDISRIAGNRECVFRGQADAGWPLASGAVRRIRKAVEDVEVEAAQDVDANSVEDAKVNRGEDVEKTTKNSGKVTIPEISFRGAFLLYHEDLLEKARQKGFGIDEGRPLSDLELLAQLQHFGAATMLLDFSRNPLVALYVACKDEEDKDGKIFIVPIGGYPVAQNSVEVKKLIEDKKVHQWSPILHGAAERRMSAQSGLFLINLPEETDGQTIFAVNIPKGDKHKILKELDQFYKINEDALFNDLAGFAQNQSHRSNLDKGLGYMYYGHSVLPENRDKDAYNTAIKFYTKSLDQNPDLVGAYYARGMARLYIGDYEEATTDFDEAIRLKPDFADAYFAMGSVKFDIGNYEGAIVDLNEVIRLKPDFAEAYHARSNVKFIIKDYEGTIEDLNKAIRLKPDSAGAYHFRGSVKLSTGNHEGAMADLNEAIRLKPDFASAYHARGRVKLDIGNHEGAMADINEAIRLRPDFAEAYCVRSNVKRQTDDYEGAMADTNEAIRLNPDFADAYHARGNVKLRIDDYEGAMADINKAIEIDSGRFIFYAMRSGTKIMLSQFDDAIEDMIKAVKFGDSQFNSDYFHDFPEKNLWANFCATLNDALEEAINSNNNERKEALEAVIRQLFPTENNEHKELIEAIIRDTKKEK